MEPLVAVYARVSTERQAEAQTIEQQLEAVRGYAIKRLIDAYVAEVVTLEELGLRRRKLEDRLEALRREGQQLVAEDVRGDRLRAIAGGIESFRAKIAQGLEQATFATKRAIVELLIDRVVVDAPEVEIRYVVPLTGAAQRKGVLRSRHRAVEQGVQAAQCRRGHLSQPCAQALQTARGGDAGLVGSEDGPKQEQEATVAFPPLDGTLSSLCCHPAQHSYL